MKMRSIGQMASMVAMLVLVTGACSCGSKNNGTETADGPSGKAGPSNETLAVIVGADAKLMQDWSEKEKHTVTHVDGAEDLVGTSRTEVVTWLGEPDRVNEDGSEEWNIGKLPEVSMEMLPALVLTFDESGNVATVNRRLGM